MTCPRARVSGRISPAFCLASSAVGAEQTDLLHALDRLAARRDAQLAVDRDRLRLHCLGRQVQSLAELPETTVGGQLRQQAQLGAGERGCSHGCVAERVELCSQLVGLLWQDAKV